MKYALKTSVIFFIIFVNMSYAANQTDWKTWVVELRQEAIEQGISPILFDNVFRDIKEPHHRVLHFDKTQPEKRITFNQYRKTRIDAFRITLGVKEYKKHKVLLEQVSQDFGVSPCFILAFWGIESSYGRFKGDFPVIRSLATLAYDNRRADYFRAQLLVALHILNEGHVSLADFKGEWAGASGNPQFLPISWKKYAVDYDHDGHKDIWNSYPDSFASIANYLVQNGWQRGEPWGIEVTLPEDFPDTLEGRKIKKTINEWVQLGVRPAYGFVLPQNESLQASIIQPYGGPAFMAFKNFRVIMRYNNSIFYAGSVGYLADQICSKIHKEQAVFASEAK